LNKDTPGRLADLDLIRRNHHRQRRFREDPAGASSGAPPHSAILKTEASANFDNTAGGSRISTSFGGTTTGF
jgi:hypothetical protein